MKKWTLISICIVSAVSVAVVILLIMPLGGSTSPGRQPLPHEMRKGGERLIKKVGRLDTIPAAGVAKKQIATEDNSEIRGRVTRSLQDGSFEEAIKIAAAESDEKLRGDLLSMIVSTWTLKDHSACYDWLMTIRPSERMMPVVTFFGTLSRANLAAAIKYLDLVPKGQFKDMALAITCFELIKNDQAELIKRVSQLSGVGTISSVASAMVDEMLGQKDFSGIQNMIEDLPHGSFRDMYCQKAVEALSKLDPSIAIDFLQKNQVLYKKGRSFQVVANQFAKTDPLKGIELAGKIEDATSRSAFLDELGGRWSEVDPEKSKAWLEDLIAKNQLTKHRHVADGIIAGLVISDHAQAKNFINSITDPSSRDAAMLVAVNSIADDDPEEAYKYYLKAGNTGSAEAVKVFSSLSTKWIERDPFGASKWIGELEAGVHRDLAVERLVVNILARENDIVMANSWASQIGDPKIKAQVNAEIDRSKP